VKPVFKSWLQYLNLNTKCSLISEINIIKWIQFVKGKKIVVSFWQVLQQHNTRIWKCPKPPLIQMYLPSIYILIVNKTGALLFRFCKLNVSWVLNFQSHSHDSAQLSKKFQVHCIRELSMVTSIDPLTKWLSLLTMNFN